SHDARQGAISHGAGYQVWGRSKRVVERITGRPAGPVSKGDCKMIRRLVATDDDIATAILRLVLGVVFFAHGAQKMLGWFGGFGFSGTMGYFTGAMHIP